MGHQIKDGLFVEFMNWGAEKKKPKTLSRKGKGGTYGGRRRLVP